MKNNPSKSELNAFLRNLIASGDYGTHESLCKALKKAGFIVDQSKISRLLHKLGAIKVITESGESRYRLPHEHGLMHEIISFKDKKNHAELISDIAYNETIIVVHTLPGAAALVAREMDLNKLKLNILGTIAGDDTIIIIPKKISQIKSIADSIKSILLSF